MTARLIGPTDAIEVRSVNLLIYGPPGVGKTSLAQTAANPFTLDFDEGIHRSEFRKTTMQFDSWQDVEAAAPEIAKCGDVAPDTLGRLLDLLAKDIIEQSPKNGTRAGGLTIQGWGVLGNRFGQWVGQLRLQGKNLIMICHEEESRRGDGVVFRPDMPGKMSYAEVMKFTDLVGHLSVENGRRTLNFNPTDTAIGKNGAALAVQTVPNFHDKPHFLAELIQEARAKLGKTAETSAEAARQVEEWKTVLAHVKDVDELNAKLHACPWGKFSKPVSVQVRALFDQLARDQVLVYDKAAKKFVPSKETAA